MHIPSHSVHTAANLQCTHTAAAITSSVHTEAIPSSAHCSTLQPSATCSQPSSAHPVHTHCSSHYIFSAHCSYIIQCTLQQIFSTHCSQSPVHTAAILSSAHCSYSIQCTLQLHYLVPILYSTFSAPLNHHRVSLYHYWPTSRTVSRHYWLIVAVPMMKKTG